MRPDRFELLQTPEVDHSRRGRVAVTSNTPLAVLPAARGFALDASISLSGTPAVFTNRMDTIYAARAAREASTLRKQQIAKNASALKAKTDAANDYADSAYLREAYAPATATITAQKVEIAEWETALQTLGDMWVEQLDLVAELRRQLAEARAARP